MRQVMSPVPSRPTLISYIKNGVLNGRRIFNCYYIYESSLREFIEKNKREILKKPETAEQKEKDYEPQTVNRARRSKSKPF